MEKPDNLPKQWGTLTELEMKKHANNMFLLVAYK